MVFTLLPVLSVGYQIPLSALRSSPFTPRFDELVKENLDRWHTPGLAIAVIAGADTYSKV